MNQQLLQKLEHKIFELRPQLKVVRDKYSNLSYFDYAKQKNRISLNKNARERKVEIVEAVKKEVTGLLGSAVAESVEKQLKKNDSISATEHTASIGATNILHATLHSSVPLFKNEDPRMRNILVFSCSGISFSNTVSFSRGVQFHGFDDNEIFDNRLTFGRSVDSQTVLYAPAYTHETINEMQKRLLALVQEGKMQKEYAQTIASLLETIFSSPHALSMTEYADQLTITNYHLWKYLFLSWKSIHIPNYVQLSQEEKIVLRLILDYHLEQQTLIYNFLFDQKYHELIEKYFEGIFGAFKNDRSYGTYLFWGISKKDNTRIQLFREGNQLVSKDGTYSLTLTPENIKNAITNKEIFPSLLLTFTVLCFYYGLLAGGGPNQPGYLTQMKDGFVKMMRELGNTDEAEGADLVATDDFVFNRSHLALVDVYGQRIPSSGLDMHLYQNPDAWPHIIEATKTIPMEEFMNVILLTYYKMYCPAEEQDQELMQQTVNDMIIYLGLDKKLPPIGLIV